MNDRIAQVLRATDDATRVPLAQPSLAHLVQSRYVRQRRRKLVGIGTIAVLAVATIFMITVTQPPPRSPVASSPPQPSTLPTLASLDIAAALHEQTAAALMQSRKPPQRSSPASDVQTQRDRAALILVYDAEQYQKQNHPTLAMSSYRRVIQLFPQTRWASLAQQRLKEMQT